MAFVVIRACTSSAQVHELPQSHCGDNREGTHIVFMITYMYYVHLTSVRFGYALRVSWITYEHS